MQTKSIKNIPVCLFLVLAGAFLYGFSSPNFIVKQGFALTAWIMYVPYFLLIKKSTIKPSWFYSGLYGILATAFYALWLYNYSPLCLIIALIIAFVGTSLFGLALKSVEKLFEKECWLVWFLFFCCFDYLRTLGFLGFHYGLAAYTQWKSDILLQSLAITGPFGLNMLVIFSSAVFFAFISKFQDKKILLHKMVSDNTHYSGASYINYVSENDRLLKNSSLLIPSISAGLWALIMIILLIYGNNALKKSHEETASLKTITVAAIQHNDSPDSNGLENYRESIQSLIQLTDEALEINPDIDIVVWPETAVVPSVVYQYFQGKDSEKIKLVQYLLNYINSRKPEFVIGNQHIVVNADSSKKNLYNSALLLSPGKNVIPPQPQIYSKIHLVPFSEYFPYERYFPHVYKALLDHEGFFWTPGFELKVFNSQGLNYYTPICFENTFPDLCRQARIQGAQCFFSLTNDSWSKSLACQYQHLAMAKFRAVENHVPVVVSSVSGYTAGISPEGIINAIAVPFTKTYVICEVPVLPNDQKITFYGKTGDVLGYVSVFLLLVVLLIRIFIVIMKKRYGRTHRSSKKEYNNFWLRNRI